MKVVQVKLSDIQQYENCRSDDFEHSELMASIKKQGLIQPIVIASNFVKTKGRAKKKKYVLVAGNRRFRSLQKLGIAACPAVLNDSVKTEADLFLVNMAENLQRKDVTTYEYGRLIYKLTTKWEMSLAECGSRLGVPLKTVKSLLDSFRHTPVMYRNDIVLKDTKGTGSRSNGKISLSAACMINSLRKSSLITANEQLKLYKATKAGTYSTHHLADFSRQVRSGASLSDVLDSRKRVFYTNLRVPILESERSKLGKTKINQVFEAIIYGETKKKFTRPKVRKMA